MLVYFYDSVYIILNVLVLNFFVGDIFPGGLTPTGKMILLMLSCRQRNYHLQEKYIYLMARS
jgi:TRAP-type C4-dicarboxylate transport system permease large subunit